MNNLEKRLKIRAFKILDFLIFNYLYLDFLKLNVKIKPLDLME